MFRAALPLIALSACTIGGGEREWHFEDVKGVWIEVGSGDVNLCAVDDRETVDVRWDGGGIGKPADPDIALEADGWLVFDAGGILGGGELEVMVPQGLPFEIYVERGDIDVGLRTGTDLIACVAAGSVDIHVPEGSYDIELQGAVGSWETSGVTNDPDSPHAIRACAATGEINIYSGEGDPD